MNLIKKNILFSLVLGFAILLATERSFSALNGGKLYGWETPLLEPLFFTALFTLLTHIFLLFFNQTIQQAWWRYVRWWLGAAIGIILVLLPTYSGGGGFVSFGDTTDLIILWGFLFVGFTFFYTLVQRFCYKTGM